jgi:hypothetical protein
MSVSSFPRFLFLALTASTIAIGCSADKDGDGYKSGVGEGADCDDSDAEVNPGADELCGDSIDNDCDGSTDEADAIDAVIWYYDGDGDSYGDPGTTEVACTAPSYFVADDTDCDDTDPAINPDTFWAPDADGDGYGDLDDSTWEQACEQPDDYLADATDCDDTRADVNPGEEELCDEVDHDCDGTDGLIDDDGDGWAECEGDCDDDPTDDPKEGPYAADTYPDAPEYCNDVDDDCDGTVDEDDAVDAPTWYLDYDGDMYGGDSYFWTQCDQVGGTVDNAEDCDDLDAGTYPGADEYCDDADNDCDGDIDEDGAVDAPTYYGDADGDGFGDSSVTTAGICDLPAGYAAKSGDCDDAVATTYPGADEYCNGADDDCDSTVDENSAVDAVTWYLDSDGDDYGFSGSTTRACNEPSGYAATPGDCNDSDDAIYPGADEYCDGADNDCDGVTDEGASVDADTWYADADGDDYGDPGTSQNACSQPPDYVADSSDCNDGDVDVNPGADEVCNDGIDNNCSGGFDPCTMDLADSDTIFLGNATNDQAARAISTVADWNADGVDDILVSSRSAGSTAGVNYLYYGASTIGDWGQITMDLSASGGADVTFTGAATGDYAAVTSAGSYDMNDDGAVDIAFGSASPDSERGRVWMVFGDYSSPPSGDLSLADADATFNGITAYDRAAGPGGLAYLGDLDGDGANDMAIGANSADDNGTSSGTAYIIYGPVQAGDHELSDVDDYIYGENANDRFGKVVTSMEDISGDGTPELVVGTLYYAESSSYMGRVYVFSTTPTGVISAADADYIYDGESLSDYAGYSVASAGDQDGDGLGDLLVGATRDDTGASDGGAGYLILGGTASGDLGSAAYAKFYGTTSSGNVGSGVAGTGDVDGADTPAVMVSATSELSGAGTVYLFYGAPSGNVSVASADATFTGTDPSDAAGHIVDFSGDLDGSGLPYLIVGTYQADLGGTDAGAAYLIGGLAE